MFIMFCTFCTIQSRVCFQPSLSSNSFCFRSSPLRSAWEGSILASPSLHLTSSFDCLWDSVQSHWKVILVIKLSLHPGFFAEIYKVCPSTAYIGCCCCCWSLLYSAIFRSRSDSLHSHVTLHEWLAFYSAFWNIHRSGVLTVLAWLVPHETAAISARSV